MNTRVAAYNILLSFVSPFLALWSTLQARGFQNHKRIVLIAIIIIYGTTLPLTERADGYRHQKMVTDLYMDMSWEQFINDAYQIVTFQISSSSADLYKHIISYISGALFAAPGLFFVIVSFVYAFFFTGSLLRIFQNFEASHKNFVFWVFVLLFLFTKNVEGIQTVRTWTGLWVLFYAVLMYHETREKKYLFLALLPPLIHFGYALMAIPAYIVLVFRSWPRIFGVIFVLSSFTNFINPESVSPTLTQYALGEQKVNQYHQEERLTSEDKLEAFEKNAPEKTWYKKLYWSGYFNWPTNLLIYAILIFGVYSKLMNSLEQRLFSVGLLTLAGSNIFFFVWAASNRMNVIGLVFVLAALVLLMQRGTVFWDFMRENRLFKIGVWLSAILVLPKFVYYISFFLSQLSAYFFVGPFIPWLDASANISAIDVIKNILSN